MLISDNYRWCCGARTAAGVEGVSVSAASAFSGGVRAPGQRFDSVQPQREIRKSVV